MEKNLYLAIIVAIAFGATILLPRLVEGNGRSLLTTLLIDSSPEQSDRLEVGSPVGPVDASVAGFRLDLGSTAEDSQ
ncbi:hypothetical protein [Dongia deserti]|uniref:hypothetical protein n=1 Tax=Dongia deserti TaxID=2268030 RepID=UPI000E6470F2|nr:hypothetical protein [Dongia deserti]